jgi:hypothetical protein
MEVLSAGVDTIRAKYSVQRLDLGAGAVRDEFVNAGWKYQYKEQFENGDIHGVGTRIGSHSMSYHGEGETLRLHLRDGQHLYAECSVPRMMTGELVNIELGAGDDVRMTLDGIQHRVKTWFKEPAFQKILRLDTAVDLAALAQMPAVISSAMQFKPPHTRKVVKMIFPGETSWIRGKQVSVRCYNKAHELMHKVGRDESYNGILHMCRQQGRTRFEIEGKLKGGYSMDVLKDVRGNVADVIESGFSNLNVYVGGLEQLRQEIEQLTSPEYAGQVWDDDLDAWMPHHVQKPVAAQTKNGLLAFAVRYAALGEMGMLSAYSRSAFYRHKQRFLQFGLSLDAVCEWHGYVDYAPVVEQLRAA